jgi:hypothetical protein
VAQFTSRQFGEPIPEITTETAVGVMVKDQGRVGIPKEICTNVDVDRGSSWINAVDRENSVLARSDILRPFF